MVDFFRLWYLSDQNVFFYFDQARDAAISRSILEEKDLKIQGPSVSGTNDSVYHGVLYYYVIAPLYTIFQGNPMVVAAFLALIGSSSVLIYYQLGREVFKSRQVGLIAAGLTAVSAVAIHQHIWLSNPQLSSIFVPLTYLFLWRLFYAPKKSIAIRDYVLLGICLAGAMQAALQSIVLLGSSLLAILYAWFSTKSVTAEQIRNLVLTGVAFVAGIATMLLTEFLMWRRGILSIESLRLGEHATGFSAAVFAQIAARYAEIFQVLLAPTASGAAALLLFVAIAYAFRKTKPAQKMWLLSFLLAPLWLLIWHYRDPNHTFIGLETVVYLLLALAVVELTKQKRLRQSLAVGLVVLFAALQLQALLTWKQDRFQYFGIQRGALLAEQTALIGKTYKIAGDTPFSIATLTSPYAINTTWSYLYDWQSESLGKQKPTYTGMPQAGYPGEGLLPESSQAGTLHFTILEPDTTLSDEQLAKFQLEQDELAGPVVEEWEFGTLVLQLRKGDAS